MAVEESTIDRHEAELDVEHEVRTGSLLMTLAGLAFVGYGLFFLGRAFLGSGFELGVPTINGVTEADLNAVNPAIGYYITHLHVAVAGFIVATGIAVMGLSWYGVRSGQLWAWATAVTAAVVGLAIALPMHYAGFFEHNWMIHLGPIYVATIVFVVGAALALRGLRAASGRTASRSM